MVEQKDNKLLDKIKGQIFGLALGDALGAPHEFYIKKYEYTGKLEFPIERFNRYKKTFETYGSIGSVTDDTQMTFKLWNALLNCSVKSICKFNETLVVEEYLKFANESKFLGKNTRELFKGIKQYKSYKKRFEKKFVNQEIKEQTQSNGALMRCSPIAFFDNYLSLINQDCKLTNPSSIALQTEIIYVSLLREIITNQQNQQSQNKDELKNFLVNLLTEDVTEIIKKIVKNAIDGKSIDITTNKGWCINALYCAIYGLFNFNSFNSAIDYIIKLGGDTDTNACIAGALLGAFYGFDKINSVDINKKNIEILMKANEKLFDDINDKIETTLKILNC